jgi:predicted flap endonuclease-1-like 5' DNA nuclease
VADFLTSNTALLVLALAVAALVIGWLLLASRKTRVTLTSSQDSGPAQRNQALIDAPPAAVPHAELGVVPLMEPDATLVVMPSASPAPAPVSDLSAIKGLGPKLQAQLANLGVTSVVQIAAWDDADIDRIDAQLDRFQGRIRRDAWVEQAKLLAAGDSAGFADKFGNN